MRSSPPPPIAGKRIDLTGGQPRQRSRGGVALTREEWNKVIDHLFTLDPADGVTRPKRGGYSLADRIAVQANAIDLTILQALTGLRVCEATAITWPMVEFTDDGEMVLDRSPAIVKTRTGRRLGVVRRTAGTTRALGRLLRYVRLVRTTAPQRATSDYVDQRSSSPRSRG